MDGEKFLDGQITLLQTGIVDFEFLNYLEANPKLALEKLVNVFRYAYPKPEQEEGTSVEDTSMMGTIGRVQDAGPSEVKEAETTEQIALEIPAEISAKEEGQGRKAQEEVEPLNEDPRNTRKLKCTRPFGL